MFVMMRFRGAEELQKKMESTKELNADAVAARVQLDLERKIVTDEAPRNPHHLSLTNRTACTD